MKLLVVCEESLFLWECEEIAACSGKDTVMIYDAGDPQVGKAAAGAGAVTDKFAIQRELGYRVYLVSIGKDIRVRG